MSVINTIILIVVALLFAAVIFRQRAPPWRVPPKRAISPDETSDSARILRRMKRLAQPTLLLVPDAPGEASKLGGEPDLPHGAGWPRGPEGALAFLGQADLAETRAADGPEWLPDDGTIYAFHDDRFGMADQARVLYFPRGDRAALQAPPDLPKSWRYRERRIGFRRLTSIPSLDWLGEDVRKIEVTEAELDELADLPAEPFGKEPQHRIGGYPSEIQDDQMALSCEYLARGLERKYGEPVPPAIERAARQWRMLLQIDSDPKLGMKWADGGRFYIFIREDDARAAEFSKTVTLFQTY